MSVQKVDSIRQQKEWQLLEFSVTGTHLFMRKAFPEAGTVLAKGYSSQLNPFF